MTPEQVALVEQTTVVLQPRLDEVVTDLVRRLEAAPSHGGPDHPAGTVVRDLIVLAGTIRWHDRFVAGARALARQLDGAGAAHHLRSLRPVVLASLAASLAEAWTPEVADAWRLAYNLTTSAIAVGP